MNLPLLAIGFGPIALAANGAANTEVETQPQNGGLAGRLLLSCDDSGSDCYLSALTHRRDPLISGYVPVELFYGDSVCNPTYGAHVARKDKLAINGINYHATDAYDVQVAWEVVTGGKRRLLEEAVRAGRLRPREGSKDRPKSLIAAGSSDAPQSIAAAGSYEFTIDIDEDFRPGHLVIPKRKGLYVTSFTVNGQPILDSSQKIPAELFARDCDRNPVIAQHLAAFRLPSTWTTEDTVKVTIANSSAAAIRCAPCVTAV